jgi:transcriptional regulator with XRE-family HTH domain
MAPPPPALAAALRRALSIYETQKELGEMLGVSQQSISKWINGKAKPGAKATLRLARLLDNDRHRPERLRPDIFLAKPLEPKARRSN